MASEKDFELLDQYVSNRLAAQERTAFEKKLAEDSSLRQEFQIQQAVVKKIREARVSELKTMFNSVPTTALETGGTSVGSQIALWAGVATVVGAGVYFYLTSDSGKTPQNVSQQDQVTNEVPQATEPAQTPATDEPTDNKPSEQAVTPPAKSQEESSEPAQSPTEPGADDEAKGPAPIDVFDPSEEDKQSTDSKIPEVASGSTPLHKSSIAVELDSNNKRYDFHYQFKNGKLFLYGMFEKNLYEIMEFFSDNKRTVFLFYKDNYYLLNEDNDTVKPLTPISDPTLLKKLKDYRGTR
jgi:hypothetical protein